MISFVRKIAKNENRRVYEGLYQDNRCCIKVLTSQNPHQRALFEEEYRILTHISHPNIPKAIGFEETDMGPAMILSYIEGITLREYIDRKNEYQTTISFETIYYQITKIIQEIHLLKSFQDNKPLSIIHRDLKPSNILIHLPSKKIFVCDLGIAYYDHPDKKVQSNPTQRKTSIMYCAPEYLLEGTKNVTIDYFSLGWIFLEMLTDQKPPGFVPNRRKYNQIRASYLNQIPEKYQQAISLLTEFSPQDRRIISLENPTAQSESYSKKILFICIGIMLFFLFLLTNSNIIR